MLLFLLVSALKHAKQNKGYHIKSKSRGEGTRTKMSVIGYKNIWADFEQVVIEDWWKASHDFHNMERGPNFTQEYFDIDRRLTNARKTIEAIQRLNAIRDHMEQYCGSRDFRDDGYLKTRSEHVLLEYTRAKVERSPLCDLFVEVPNLIPDKSDKYAKFVKSDE